MNGDTTREIGRFGEQVVCDYLKRKNCLILERNYFTRHGEIDIIAEDDTHLLFIEVKTRSETAALRRYGRPANAVNQAKWQHIISAANVYIKSHHRTKPFRLDVAEVYLTKFIDNNTEIFSTRINYIKSAYRRW